MPTTEQILDSIERRLREILQEVDTLTAARAALDGRIPVAAKRPRTTARKNGRPQAEVSAEVVAETALAPTAEDSVITDGRRSRTPTARKRRRKPSRPGEVVPAGKLELLLAATEGLTTSALAERAHGDRNQVLTLLRELEAAGRVRRTGQRRSTRWHAITDEERIQQRAAELAALSKRSA